MSDYDGEMHTSFGAVASFALQPKYFPTSPNGVFLLVPHVELFSAVVACAATFLNAHRSHQPHENSRWHCLRRDYNPSPLPKVFSRWPARPCTDFSSCSWPVEHANGRSSTRDSLASAAHLTDGCRWTSLGIASCLPVSLPSSCSCIPRNQLRNRDAVSWSIVDFARCHKGPWPRPQPVRFPVWQRNSR